MIAVREAVTKLVHWPSLERVSFVAFGDAVAETLERVLGQPSRHR